ncbi:hypothetical protein, partial [Thauera sp. Sel9]|uniref:hypothetical protein n=1 Tax=Thauera sp. Sel9 TaxID=2974299 RepID=UPI0021E14877
PTDNSLSTTPNRLPEKQKPEKQPEKARLQTHPEAPHHPKSNPGAARKIGIIDTKNKSASTK